VTGEQLKQICNNSDYLPIAEIIAAAVKIPPEEFHKAVRDGSVGHKLRRILEDTKPDAVYFTK